MSIYYLALHCHLVSSTSGGFPWKMQCDDRFQTLITHKLRPDATPPPPPAPAISTNRISPARLRRNSCTSTPQTRWWSGYGGRTSCCRCRRDTAADGSHRTLCRWCRRPCSGRRKKMRIWAGGWGKKCHFELSRTLFSRYLEILIIV